MAKRQCQKIGIDICLMNINLADKWSPTCINIKVISTSPRLQWPLMFWERQLRWTNFSALKRSNKGVPWACTIHIIMKLKVPSLPPEPEQATLNGFYTHGVLISRGMIQVCHLAFGPKSSFCHTLICANVCLYWTMATATPYLASGLASWSFLPSSLMSNRYKQVISGNKWCYKIFKVKRQQHWW